MVESPESDVSFAAILGDLPPFPSVALEMAQALSGDPEQVRIDDIVGLIRSDPGLSSELLRRANSPLYGFQSKIDSMQQCLVLLGFEEVRRLALALSARRFAGKALERPELARCWSNSVACAVLAEKIAPPLGLPAERAYTAGLMHDIGRLSLFAARPAEYAELLQAAAEAGPIDDTVYFLDRERETFGFDHTAAGAWLADQWGLPDELRLIAGRHHDRPENSSPNMLAVVYYAVRAADALGFGITPTVSRGDLESVFAPLPEHVRHELTSWPDSLASEVRERTAKLAQPIAAEAEPTQEPDEAQDEPAEAEPAPNTRFSRTGWEVTAGAALIGVTLLAAIVLAMLR